MISYQKILTIFIFCLLNFVVALYTIFLTYEFRIISGKIDQLKIEAKELSFRSNILLEEVEYFRNQTTLGQTARESLGMRPPKTSEKIIIFTK